LITKYPEKKSGYFFGLQGFKKYAILNTITHPLPLAMDWDLELHAEKLQHMLTVYQDHIEELEAEAKEMQKEILFLKEQLDLKTLGYEKYEDLNPRG